MQRKNFSFLLANPLAGVFVALLIIFVLSAVLSPYFLTSYNMSVIARSLAFVGLVTIGQSMLLILGELDLSLGVIGEYIGKIYLESKHRPRYIISERTWEPYERHYKG